MRKKKTETPEAEPGIASVKPIEHQVSQRLVLPVAPTTREKLLYKVACAGTPLGNEFFDQFTDRQEILDLALSISVRLCVVAICNSELAPTQRISAMRLVAALNGKQLPSEDETQNRPLPLAVPAGSKEDVTRTLEAIKRVSGEQ